MKKQHHVDVPGSGGHGSRQGDMSLNRKLMAPQDNVERTTRTRDVGNSVQSNVLGWPSMYDMARAMTSGKWGNGGKWK